MAHLRSWIEQAGPEVPPDRDDLLLSLARAAKLLDAVWSQDELQRLRPRIAQRTDRAPLGRVVRDVVRAQHDEAATAVSTLL